MGANAQTSVPTFTAGEVLTAANMNISARTGVPVFSNTTTRDAGFGGTGEKTLAEGQLCYLEDSNVVQYYDGAAWATVGPTAVSSALTRVTGATVSSQSTVTISNAFSATYDAYMVVLSNISGSTGLGITATLGTTATGYKWGGREWYPATASADRQSGASTTNFELGNVGTNAGGASVAWIINPYLSIRTGFQVWYQSTQANPNAVTQYGFLDNATSYTSLVLTTTTGTFSGNVNVYGVALS